MDEFRHNVDLDDGRQVQIVTTNEGIIIDTFANNNETGTLGMTFDELYDFVSRNV